MLLTKSRKDICILCSNFEKIIKNLLFNRNALSSQAETEKLCDRLKSELSDIKAEYKLLESSTGSQQKDKK